MSVVDNAIYVDGRRVKVPRSLDHTFEELRSCGGGSSFCWIGLLRPTHEEIRAVAEEFGLHALAVEDTVTAHQRPKLERYDDVLFVVLRPARYVDREEVVELGEVHLFVGPDFVITVRHAEEPDLAAVRHRLEADPGLLDGGPHAVLYAVLDKVVDDYVPVLDGLQDDIDGIEVQVFGGDPGVSRRIYTLTREVIEFQRATKPLASILEGLMQAPGVGEEERRYLRDVHDHAMRIEEQADGFRELLRNILDINLTLETKALSETSTAQNEEVKRISAWAAILFAPTLIGSIYGMNFEHMPELDWLFGYPFALALMVAASVTLFVTFRRRGWI